MSRPSCLRLVLALSVGLAGAMAGRVTAAELNVGASVTPAFARIGEAVTYTAFVELPPGALMRPKWLPPDSAEALTWGALRPARRPTREGLGDTLFIEARLQAFQLGTVLVPGMAFIDEARPGSPPMRLPAVRLTVLPLIPASDSTADLKPVRGPLKAPWWEVVPWLIVIAVGLVAGVIGWGIMRLSRRPGAGIAAVQGAQDPSDAALKRLAELRARRLPEAGEFGAHALELTVILRRFLEATSVRLRPGFTTTEMTRQLQDESVPAQEATLLLNLLRVWDRVKFARAPFTIDEAQRSEFAVEEFVGRIQRPGSREAA